MVGAATLTSAPDCTRNWPSVTITSPARRPRVTTTSLPTRRPVWTGTISALPPTRALLPRMTMMLSPCAEVWIAVAGTSSAPCCTGSSSAAVTYMPGRNARSPFPSSACTLTLRVSALIFGSIAFTFAVKRRPGQASLVTMTVAPGFNRLSSCCGRAKSTNRLSSAVSVATASPGLRYWPRLTCRMPNIPAKGARTCFWTSRASICCTAAAA